jgi:hypothetical protein
MYIQEVGRGGMDDWRAVVNAAVKTGCRQMRGIS